MCQSRIFDIAFSPQDPFTLATAAEDCTLIWSAEPGAPPQPKTKLETSCAMRCAWHGAGKHLLTGSTEGVVSVWTVDDGTKLASLSCAAVTDDRDEGAEIYGINFLDGNNLLAVGCSDTVQQWDLPHARLTCHTQLAAYEKGLNYGGANRNPTGRAYVFSIAARGRCLAAAMSDGTVRLLDSQTCREITVLDEHAQRGAAAFACALSPTMPILATTAADGAVLLYDLRAYGHGPLADLRGHTQPVHGVCFAAAGALGADADANGELLVTGGADRSLRFHETRTNTCVCAVRSSGPVLCTAFGSGIDAAAPTNGARVAAAGGSGQCGKDNSLSIFSAQPPAADADEAATGTAADKATGTAADKATEAAADKATEAADDKAPAAEADAEEGGDETARKDAAVRGETAVREEAPADVE